MDYRKVILASLLAVAGLSHAGYAELAAPERFSGGPGSWKFAPSANDVRYGKIAFQPNGLRVPVPGVPTTMPAAYRFAANAPRAAAAVLFLHPGIRTAIGIAAWLGIAKIVWDEVNKRWTTEIEEDLIPSDGYLYSINNASWFLDALQACKQQKFHGSDSPAFNWKIVNGNCSYNWRYASETDNIRGPVSIILYNKISECPSGWYVTPAGCVQTVPPVVLTEPEFLDKLAPKPMPDTVPWELPFPTPLPVDPPYINPNPGPSPSHNPKFVPTGDPVPNPNYDPNAAPGPANEPWFQPGVRMTPRPTADRPLRVDLEPVNRPQDGPDPLPDPDNPPDPDRPDKPKPEEEQSLCEKHPDIVACQKLGTLLPEVLQKNTVPLTITKEDGFGPASGACPAPKTFVIMGKPMAFRWDLLCDFASQIRPLLVGFAYLSAALAFMGLSRKD